MKLSKELQAITAAALVYAGAYAVVKPSVAHAHHDGSTPNAQVNKEKAYTFFHPINEKGEVCSYGFMIRNPQLEGAGVLGTQNCGELLLTGAGNVGVDLAVVAENLKDYKGDGETAAIWINAGKGDQVYLMNAQNEPVHVVSADDNGFAGVLVRDGVNQFGIRVVRASGTTEPIKASFGNMSKEDAIKDPHASVIDAVKYLKVEAPAAPVAQVAQPEKPTVQVQEAPKVVQKAEPKVVEFLPEVPVMKWEQAQGKGFFRPEGYSPFMQFSVPESPLNADGTPKFSVRGSESVGKFYILDRKAAQAVLRVRTDGAFASHIQQGQAAPALWLARLQPGTRVLLHDAGGNVLAEAKADDAGYAGVEMPTFDAEVVVSINFAHPDSSTDVEVQQGPAKAEDLAKASTVKLAGVDPSRIRTS